MSPPNYSTLGVLNFGERVSVLQAEDYPLFSLCLELVWDAALANQELRPRVTKVTMTSERVHALRGTTRRSVTRLVHQHSVEGSTMTGAELFYLCVNHFFHAEGDPSVREFLAPVMACPRRLRRDIIVISQNSNFDFLA